MIRSPRAEREVHKLERHIIGGLGDFELCLVGDEFKADVEEIAHATYAIRAVLGAFVRECELHLVVERTVLDDREGPEILVQIEKLLARRFEDERLRLGVVTKDKAEAGVLDDDISKGADGGERCHGKNDTGFFHD